MNRIQLLLSAPRRMRPVLLATALLTLAAGARAGLFEYLNNGDKTYEVKVLNRREASDVAAYSAVNLDLVSQTWRGTKWKHAMTILKPKDLVRPELAMLFITGGTNTASGEPVRALSPEVALLAQVAVKTKSIVAVLNQIPNQPILEGRSEDAAIAYTLDQFIKTGEQDWPLLFPMTKSAHRAMDAMRDVCKAEYGVELKEFFVAGASKRGWTTWLTGASDPRVIAIAPLVIDNLNMPKQMPHQLESWGKFSEMINDYVILNLPQMSTKPEIAKAMAGVDPYTHLDKLKLPKLMVNGTNDPYWVLDANRHYFNDLKGERYTHYVPNAGHGLGAGAAEAVGGFYMMVKGNQPRPAMGWSTKGDGANVNFEVKVDREPKEVRLWQGFSSPDKDFRDAVWASTPVTGTGAGAFKAAIPLPKVGFSAFYAELVYESETGDRYGLCTTVRIIGGTEPTDGASDSNGE